MIVDNVEIHNSGALESMPGLNGMGLARIPADVRNRMNHRARFVGMDSVGCELRFVCDAPNVDVYLTYSKPEFADNAEVRIYKGNYLCSTVPVTPGVHSSIRLIEPPAFATVRRETIDAEGFSSKVWRVCMNRGGTCCFHGINSHGYAVRPPAADEKPRLKWLAYGSSITNSSLDGYPHVAARLLKVDVQNKGLSGACHCEPEMADWIASSCEWDFLTCEMGVNMRGSFTPEQFRERVDYLLRKVTSAHPGKPIVAINIFPNNLSEDRVLDRQGIGTESEIAFNRIVRELVKEIAAPNLHLIEGRDILTDFTGLSGDLLHPSTFGHSIMGFNLAAKLKTISGIAV